MKSLFLNPIKYIALALALAVTVSSCKDKDDDDPEPTPVVKAKMDTLTIVSSSRTLSKDTIYILSGFVYVENGATLTIPAGTIIKGDKASMGTLIVERGAKIMAEGTKEQPIVFTSAVAKNGRESGDWGGVVICGKAKANPTTTPKVEGGPRSEYGGTDDADNSGILKYVRIEFPGFPFQPDKEINGLTLCAVGSGTVIENIQVSYSNDDSYEFFGGTVNCKNLIAYKGIDDEFDTDYGYSGKVQYALGIRDYREADISGSNGFESDNDGDASSNTPMTTCVFANVSLIGPLDTLAKSISGDYKHGLHMKKNTKLSIYNSVIAGWSIGVNIDGETKAWANAKSGDLNIKYCAIAGCKTKTAVASGTPTDVNYTAAGLETFLTDNDNTFYATTDDIKIRKSFANIRTKGTDGKFSEKENATITLKPEAGSALLSGANWSDSKVSTWFTKETFIGAFGATDWTEGWANWSPNSTDYTKE